jgi:hypothetical protein
MRDQGGPTEDILTPLLDMYGQKLYMYLSIKNDTPLFPKEVILHIIDPQYEVATVIALGPDRTLVVNTQDNLYVL